MTDHTTGDWRAAGACVAADPDLFFPISGRGPAARQAERALRVCAGCLVRRQCLEFALRAGEEDGIWGGTTPEERIRIRRAVAAPSPLRQRPQRRSGPLAS
jgi:WhiB family redox-sensing transcriptional regulator